VRSGCLRVCKERSKKQRQQK